RMTFRSQQRSGRAKMLFRRRWCGRSFSAAAGIIWLRPRTARSCADSPVRARTFRKAVPSGCICRRSAAAHWPNEESEGRNDKKPRNGGQFNDRVKNFTPRRIDRLERARSGRRLLDEGHVSGSAGECHYATVDRGGQEGRQSSLVHLGGSAACRES